MHRRHFLQSSALAATTLTATAAQPPKPRIKVGQIGTGHGHAGKITAYRRSADYEVVGIVEPNAALRQQAEQKEAFKDLPWMTREQLLNVPGLQAVIVETQVKDLLDNAEACVSAGKHIHFDKPAGESLAQFRRILDAATKQKLMVQMGYMYRYNPGIVMLRDFYKKGWLGEIFEIHAVMSKVIGAGERREPAGYPGGMMFELGCHLIDLVVALLGKPATVTPFAQHVSKIDDKLLDNMLAVLVYPKATATVKSSAVEVAGNDRRHFVVCGTEGTFHIQPLDKPAARVALSKPRGEYKTGYQDVTFPKYTRFIDDAADMARVIRSEKSLEFTPEHDLAVQETVLKACGLPVG